MESTSHHHADHRAATAGENFEVRTAGGRRGSGARVGEHQTFPLARHTFKALQRFEGLLMNLEFPEIPSPLTQKAAKGIGEFETYIRNNEEFIPNFGERYRNGETAQPSLNRR